jgi:hypothetical protein
MFRRLSFSPRLATSTPVGVALYQTTGYRHMQSTQRMADEEDAPNPRGYPPNILAQRQTMTEAEREAMDRKVDRSMKATNVSAVLLGAIIAGAMLFGSKELTDDQEANKKQLLEKLQAEVKRREDESVQKSE